MKEIYFSGGCFWGVEAYFKKISGVIKTEVGYANGKGNQVTYHQVCRGSGHAEVVHLWYDPEVLPLESLLQHFYAIIDPTTLNKQGNDIGIQYRSGIYYVDSLDLVVIQQSIQQLQTWFSNPLQIEVKPLQNFCPAEFEHQDYASKHPPTCSIPPLSSLQYHVLKEKGTEPPFQNEYFDQFEEGIYVDRETGTPLFSSKDKFQSSCGWPSFSKPLPRVTKKRFDFRHGMIRMEVVNAENNNHLGHVFSDGPFSLGGKRYCINSTALRFIPKEQLEKEGYGVYCSLFEN